MGWTFYHKPPGAPVKEEIRKLFDFESDRVSSVMLDCAIVKLRTAYVAVSHRFKDGREPEVFCAVVLLEYGERKGDSWGNNFGYKDMDETMGPCECECPERILSLLTPTTHKWALEWREKCWAKIAAKKARPKIKPGLVFKAPENWNVSGLVTVTGKSGRRWMGSDESGRRMYLGRKFLEVAPIWYDPSALPMVVSV